ncbi:MAG: flagellar basal-body rod protein FlgF [Alphaproteobacteria bacterium]|nr:MAG: flagellar basal-body rod protein FlgF [Alphaproteobacteria bacterium]
MNWFLERDLTVESSAYVAISQQTALTRQMEIIANNIANISTAGFKSSNLAFKEYLAKNEDGEDTSYVQELGVVTDFSQGSITHTGADFDFAINGEGFFTVGTAAGNRFTRDGHFRLDGNGQIVNENGDPLLSDGGAPIVVPSAAEQITVAQDGTIYADKDVIGKIGLVGFKNAGLLEREGAGLYKLPQGSIDAPAPIEHPVMVQGSIEASNVQSVQEMTKMMQVSRSYESAQKMIEREDDRVRQAIRRLAQMQ